MAGRQHLATPVRIVINANDAAARIPRFVDELFDLLVVIAKLNSVSPFDVDVHDGDLLRMKF